MLIFSLIFSMRKLHRSYNMRGAVATALCAVCGRAGFQTMQRPTGAWLQQKTHGNRPRIFLALRTRSTPMAMAAVR